MPAGVVPVQVALRCVWRPVRLLHVYEQVALEEELALLVFLRALVREVLTSDRA